MPIGGHNCRGDIHRVGRQVRDQRSRRFLRKLSAIPWRALFILALRLFSIGTAGAISRIMGRPAPPPQTTHGHIWGSSIVLGASAELASRHPRTARMQPASGGVSPCCKPASTWSRRRTGKVFMTGSLRIGYYYPCAPAAAADTAAAGLVMR